MGSSSEWRSRPWSEDRAETRFAPHDAVRGLADTSGRDQRVPAPTIQDVAAARVSPTTVSNLLNGRDTRMHRLLAAASSR